MAKSKTRKNHKQKVNARNNEIKMQKDRDKNIQKNFLMDLINKEKENGMFSDTKIENVSTDGPSLSFDGDLLTINDLKTN